MNDRETSRREFLKMLGLGSLAAALSMSSMPGVIEKLVGTVNSRRSDLDLGNIDVRRSDPEKPGEHKFWFREDLEGEK